MSGFYLVCPRKKWLPPMQKWPPPKVKFSFLPMRTKNFNSTILLFPYSSSLIHWLHLKHMKVDWHQLENYCCPCCFSPVCPPNNLVWPKPPMLQQFLFQEFQILSKTIDYFFCSLIEGEILPLVKATEKYLVDCHKIWEKNVMTSHLQKLLSTLLAVQLRGNHS